MSEWNQNRRYEYEKCARCGKPTVLIEDDRCASCGYEPGSPFIGLLFAAGLTALIVTVLFALWPS